MKLEDQVVSLELAKKMEELGFRQESLFWWGRESGIVNYDPRICTDLSHWDRENMLPLYAAYTVAELGGILPPYIETEMEGQSGKKYKLRNWLHLDLEELSYTIDEVCPCGCGELVINNIWGGEAKTEADARAKMLIHLAESELLTK